MPIPDYQSLMLPILRLASDGNEHRFRDAVESLAIELNLSDSERAELLPSGTAPLFDNRVGWARTYLKQAGLLASPRRGYFKITDRGRSVLSRKPSRVDNALLSQYKEFLDFTSRRNDGNGLAAASSAPSGHPSPEAASPEDALASAYLDLRTSLSRELLEQLRNASPTFFERVVVDLLLKMGYGGSRVDAGKAIGKSGDGGIDGVINEDRLGLDAIYIQAKRWTDTVGRPEIQKFAGALQGQRATKGIFITTSVFSPEAKDYASRITSKIVLIDGNRLAELMIENDVGVTTVGKYEVKKLDGDFFDEG